MADVFISYASEDRERAGRLASALSACGWSVWWDRKIVTGAAFDTAIERELESAKSVVVLWSAHSIESEWVKNEASHAAERGVLVPAFIEDVKLPLEFRRKQTADLIGWEGDPSHAGFHALCEGIAALIGGSAPHPPLPPKELRSMGKPLWLLAALVAVALALTLYAMRQWRSSTKPVESVRAERSKTSDRKTDDGGRPAVAAGELADLVVGNYHGEVIADSKAGSRGDITVKIAKLARSKVRVTSDYQRLGAVEIALTRNGNQIVNADGDTPFVVDLERSPPTLLLDPRGEIAYRGKRRE